MKIKNDESEKKKKKINKVEDKKEKKKTLSKSKKKSSKKKKNNRWKKFKKTKVGKFLSNIFSIFSGSKSNYSFSEMFIVMIVSLVIGSFACLSVITLSTGGRNIFKMSKSLGKFYDVYNVLVDNYYGEIDDEELIDAGIVGMVSSVGDSYTSYSDTEVTDEFDELVNGVYEGIGCTIGLADDIITVVAIYEDSPAMKAGLKVNDIVKKVDKLDASEVGIYELSEYIKTEADSKITMVIERDGEEMTLSLKRGRVEIPAVDSEIIEQDDKKIGYLNISIFSSVASSQFERELKKLEDEGIDALIVDVRDNNGGYLTSVTSIVSKLLPKGKVIYQVQKDKKKKAIKDKTAELRDYPIAVLINENSASASEIFAGAIKESYGGFVVGNKSYGKGTVQQVKKLKDGSMVKYTIENWLTPNGNWINEVGIEPTDSVELDSKYYQEPTQENDSQLQKAIVLVNSLL